MRDTLFPNQAPDSHHKDDNQRDGEEGDDRDLVGDQMDHNYKSRSGHQKRRLRLGQLCHLEFHFFQAQEAANFSDKKLPEKKQKSCPEWDIAELNKRDVDDRDEDLVCDRIKERSKWRYSMASSQNPVEVIRKSEYGEEKEGNELCSRPAVEKNARNGETDDSHNG